MVYFNQHQLTQLSLFKKRAKHLRLSVFCLLFLTGCLDSPFFDARPYTAILFTNNSEDSLLVSVDIDAPTSHWVQHATEIMPYQTKRLITLSRSINSSRVDYDYTITLTHPHGDQLSLIQNINNQNQKETLSFSIQSVDINPPLIDENGYHRFISGYNTQLSSHSVISIKAHNKAVYQDLHYSLTPMPSGNVNSNQQGMHVLTYNVWGLPFVAQDIRPRFRLIPQYIKHYDVVLLQEVFDASAIHLLNSLAEDYPYQTKILDGPTANLFNGGVVIISKHPIVQEADKVFSTCNGADCLANKGVKYAEIVKDGEHFHFFATHLASFDSIESKNSRLHQLETIQQFIQRFSIPPHEKVIIGGDFNIDKVRFPEEYQAMLGYLGVDEPIFEGYKKSTFDTDINGFSRLTSKSPQYIDYIFMSNQFGDYNRINNQVFIPRSSDESLWGKWDLSDHFPVSAYIE